MRVSRLFFFAATFGLAFVARERTAHAQLHWDTGLEAALEKRFLTNRAGVSDAGFGPSFRLTGHVALLPLIRVGLYGGYTLSPQAGTLRHMVTGGFETRLFPPLGIPNFRPFALLGFGYQRTFAGSQNGGCLETPLGVGASYRVRKPFEIGALVTTRIGFGCGGNLYSVPNPAAAPGSVMDAPSGQDRFGLSLGLFAALEL